MSRDLLEIAALDAAALTELLDMAERPLGTPLAGRGVAMVFEKPSARTRSSTEMAAVQLGAHPVYIQKDEVGIGTRETPEDVARTLACYHALICARVARHAHLDAMAAATDTPLLNLLSERAHPLQALADLLTIRQLVGRIEGVPVAYVGDANNVCRSLAEGCALLGARLSVASPEGHGFDAAELARLPGVRQLVDPADAVAGARIVYTDVWVSMGEADAKKSAFGGYQVTGELMARADDAWFLHCLPAHRGEEVAADVMDGPRSEVWRQAGNRMHTARAAMAWMLGARA